MVAVDFFCGAGGTTCGLLAAGIDVMCGVDVDLSAKETYEQNQRPNGTPCTFIHKSVVDVAENDLSACLTLRRDAPVLFTGCPPCQPFTNLKTDKRSQGNSSQLALRFLDQICQHKPEYVLMENVPGIRHEKYGTVFAEFIDRLATEKYSLDYRVLNARDYGVPQSRRRMILIASLLGPIRIPKPSHRAEFRPHIGAEAAFRFPGISAGACHPTIPNHRSACLSETNLCRIRAIKTPGGSRNVWDDELQLSCYRNHTGHTDVYGRIDPKQPAPTLTTRFNSLSNGRFGHPTEDRALSLREGAALQTFPDDYVFHGANAKTVARHIGNAVPVLLATALGSALLAHYAEQAVPPTAIETSPGAN